MSNQANWPYVINLGNSIIGVSILAMPFCFKQCGIVLGMLLLMLSAVLTHVSCNLLMKAAVTSKKRSYEFLALHTFGYAGKLAVELSIIGLLIGTCIAFHVIIGDLGPAIISKATGIENTSNLRIFIMVTLGLCVALPLGMLRNIESLSNISAVSIGFYTVFIAEVITASFPNLWSMVWVTKVEMWNPEGVFKCLPIFSVAFGCQTQLFVMYDSLPEPSLKAMQSITKNAIAMCTFMYLSVGFFAYVAFCDEDISGDVLMNFRPTIFSEAIKFGFVLSVALSFPLCIFPLRASLYTLLFAKTTGTHENLGGATFIPELHFKIITFFTVITTLVVGIVVPNIEFVLAITGATMGALICFIFPAITFISVMSLSKTSSKSTAQVVLFLGVTILLASTYVTLYSQDQAQPKAKSVVKVAPPNVAGKGALDKEIHKDVKSSDQDRKKDGDDVIKDPAVKRNNEPANKDKAKTKAVVDRKDEKRREPPLPHAPDRDKEKEKSNGDTIKKPVEKTKAKSVDSAAKDKHQVAKTGEKKDEAKDKTKETVKKTDTKDAAKKDENSQKAQDKLKKDSDQAKRDSDLVQKVSDQIKKDSDKSKKESEQAAKKILAKLKEQQEEQRQLIKEQRKLIEELKQHKQEAHNQKQQVVQGQQNVPQGQQQNQQQIGQGQQQVPQGQRAQQQVPQGQRAQQQVPQGQLAQQQDPQGQPAQQQIPQGQPAQQQVLQGQLAQQQDPQGQPVQQQIPQGQLAQQQDPQGQPLQQQVPQGQPVQQQVPQGQPFQQQIPQGQLAQQQVAPGQLVQQQVAQGQPVQQQFPQGQPVQQQVLQGQQGVRLQQQKLLQQVMQNPQQNMGQGVPQPFQDAVNPNLQQNVGQNIPINKQQIPQQHVQPQDGLQNVNPNIQLGAAQQQGVHQGAADIQIHAGQKPVLQNDIVDVDKLANAPNANLKQGNEAMGVAQDMKAGG